MNYRTSNKPVLIQTQETFSNNRFMHLTKLKMALLLFVLVTGFNFLQAQTAEPLTLDKAIELSLKNSKQLRGSQARIDQAVAATHEASDQRLPDVKASGSYLRVNNPKVDLKISQDSAGGSSSSNEKVSSAAYAMVNASLPIYSGLRIKYGIESAKYLEQAAKLDAENDRDAIIMNTINAYNNLYKSKLQVDVVTQSLQQAQQRVTDFSNLEKNGLLARNDLLKSQLQASNIELNLVDAQNNHELANINMDLMLGIPDTAHLVLDSTSFVQSVTADNIENYMQLALQNRKDFTALDFRKKAAGSQVKSIQGEKYPTVALTGGYVALDVPHALSVYNAVNVGVGVSYSLSNLWKTEAKVAQAKARQREVEADQDQLSDDIKLQIGRAYLDYLTSTKKISVYSLAIDQAEENYRITKNKFDNSLATTTDLLEAEVAQLQARLNFSYAKSDAMVAYKRLQQASGTLSTTK